MDKKKLTSRVARKTGLTNAVAAKATEAVFQAIQEGLANSESTLIHGFGGFTVAQRAARRGVNPSTKQPMIIPAHKVVKFTASKKFELK